MSQHSRSLLPVKRIFCNENEALNPAPPPPRFARYASSSGPPPPLRGGGKSQRSRNAIRVGVLSMARYEMGKSASLSTTRHLLFSSLKKKGRQNADRRRSNGRACAQRALSGARTPVGVPPRLSPKGIIPSQRLGFRPGFLGRGLHGRYPPSPVPVQGCTSHPGHNAGRHDAQAARERTANPPAGTAPAPPHGLPPGGVLGERDGLIATARR